MSSAKLQQISRDIEVARCKGNWQAIPELARRYKKYNPDGTVTEQTILAEASLSQLVASQSVADYSHDSPTHISLDERLDPNAIKSVQNQLRAVLQLPDDQNHPQKEFANIVMARSYFECGEYEKTLEIVEKLSFNREDVSEGYGFVLFLQARTVKAISLEILGNIDAALQSYEGIVNLLNEGIHVPRERVLADWAENALYRGSLLALREG
ncbi:uncharacterized protein BYT42DRAFT_410897 [Radiomyces spectabilis]|uniref:uncharacterized protein n=1 Tax=Radiomyces spectabilis TaxID=64574 RepID=UPI00221EA753|nr:uncharacterized protein BYT42DRAFT_410897 [Radiomyces spectabilis]KAI8374555.1 hypothetical protein BYT42DRAFT_410897 [Radiomyces spectabilis]